MKSRLSRLLLGCALTVGAGLSLPAAPASAAPAPVAQTAVVDGEVELLKVGLDTANKLTVKGKTGEVGDFVYHLKDSVLEARPTPASYDFLGQVGTQWYFAPERTSTGDELEPTWSAEGITADKVDPDEVKVSLTGFAGPGRMEAFTETGTAPATTATRVLGSETVPSAAVSLPIGTTTPDLHFAFSAVGRYRLTFEVSAKLAGATTEIKAAPVEVTFVVGALPTTTTAKDATVTTLAAPTTAIAANTDLDLTGTVTSTLTGKKGVPAAPRGSVEIFNGTTSLGEAQVAADGKYTFKTKFAAGTHQLKATFTPKYAKLVPAGAANDAYTDYETSTSTVVSYTPGTASGNGTATTTVLTASPADSAEVGAAVTLTATVTPLNVAGSVEFSYGTTPTVIGTAAVDVATGKAALAATTTLPVGEHVLKATFTPTAATHTASTDTLDYEITTDDTETPGPDDSEDPGADGDDDEVPTSTTCTVVIDGHVDYVARMVGGKLKSMFRDGSNTMREPSIIAVHVKDSAKKPLAAGRTFIGLPGSTVWEIPQTQQAGIPYLGYSNEGVTSAVTWSLDRIQAPAGGRFVLYEVTGTAGTPKVVLSSSVKSKTLANQDHFHGTWAFTKQGIYKLTFTHKTADGAKDTETLIFTVGASSSPTCTAKVNNDSLANTGAPVLLWASVGTMLFSAGATFLVLANRRWNLI